jgi:hypothetical protein
VPDIFQEEDGLIFLLYSTEFTFEFKIGHLTVAAISALSLAYIRLSFRNFQQFHKKSGKGEKC